MWDNPQNALDFLPPDIAALPLYQWLGPLIDYELLASPEVDQIDLDPLVAQLGLQYGDAEAVNAYTSLFVRPVLGTRKALDYAFQITNIEPTLDEWFVDPTLGLVPFHFQLTFETDTVPKFLNLPGLVNLVLTLKNERSKLFALRMYDCADILTLDNNCTLDYYYLDNIEGYLDPTTGVIVCLHDNSTQAVADELRGLATLHTSDTATFVYAMAAGLLDFTALDMDSDLDAGALEIQSASTWEFAQALWGGARSFDPITHAAAPHSVGITWERALDARLPPLVPHLCRTEDFVQDCPLDLVPAVPPIVSSRLSTRALPATALYAQRTWTEHYQTEIDFRGAFSPPGDLLVWERGAAWVSDQPQAHCTHTSAYVDVPNDPATLDLSDPAGASTFYVLGGG